MPNILALPPHPLWFCWDVETESLKDSTGKGAAERNPNGRHWGSQLSLIKSELAAENASKLNPICLEVSLQSPKKMKQDMRRGRRGLLEMSGETRGVMLPHALCLLSGVTSSATASHHDRNSRTPKRQELKRLDPGLVIDLPAGHVPWKIPA